MAGESDDEQRKRDQYGRHKERAAARQREIARQGQEIGELPKVVDSKRKAKCKKSLRSYCETYFPQRFKFGWCPAHLAAIERFEKLSSGGGLYCLGIFRGGGKTTLAEAAAMWAVSYGFRRYVVVFGASDDEAKKIVVKIKAEMETNDLLLADFPEIYYPIRCLERQANKANRQTYKGEFTRIGWTTDQIQLPTIPKSAAAGAVIQFAGLTSSFRGMAVPGPNGEIMRPDWIILDDVQTRTSAKSPTQTADRIATVQGDVLGLAGPGNPLAVVNLCTPIYPGDLAEQFLDREKFPEWRGERTKLLLAWPKNMGLWDDYARIRSESFRAGGEGEEATEFYRQNRADMDEGAEVSWPDRVDPGELSAVQNAMNCYFRLGPRAFAAEYQLEPPGQAAGGEKSIDADRVSQRLSGVPRGQVPPDCTRLVAFVDCGKNILWYAVAAFDERFGGSLVEWGTWPEQKRAIFTKAEPPVPVSSVLEGLPPDAALYAALKTLVDPLMDREFRRHDTDQATKLDVCLIDSGYETDTVHKFCRQSRHSARLIPSMGRAQGVKGRVPMAEWKLREGERANPVGSPPWRYGPDQVKGRARRVMFDSDAWKNFAFARLTAPIGGRGALMLFGDDAYTHQMLCDHLTAEYAKEATVDGRTWDAWIARPNRDNDLFDCVVGTVLAASVNGLHWSASAAAGDTDPPKKKRKSVDIEELYRQANTAGAL